MSTNRRIELICVLCAVLACLVCGGMYLLSARAEASGTAGHEMGYEQTLFDTSKVHTIDIVMNDWDGFIESADDEEYASCAVVVDGESYRNVAIRAKGNTSLSSVKQMGSQRYSFKIEFDHYEQGKTCHGLDKLSLNNIIQDNTYLKDYLSYRMMNEFGVDAPLTSFAYITVNGEDWGLYTAVECVEDSFLERLYGSDAGELYKPDSMSFGGGRGNGRGFDMDKFMDEQEEDAAGDERAADESVQTEDAKKGDAPAEDSAGGGRPDFSGGMPQGMPGGGGAGAGGGFQGGPPTMPGDSEGSESGATDSQSGKPGGGGPGGGMGSADVRLQYIDDDPASYANIFDNAKTPATYADQKRLIESLRKLGNCEDLESVLDMDEVLRYFVVHDYVCNGDSYTGTMVHNYYLHESDGQLSMIPWDYNLAFGGFNGGDATTLVNSPIDDPTSSGFGFGGGGTSGKKGAASGEDASSQAGEEGEDAEAGRADAKGSSQPPEGMEMPQGMQPPEGMEMPQGMQPPEGMEMPEGAQPPSGMSGDKPSAKESEGGSSSSRGSDGKRPQMPGGGMFSFSGGSDERPMVDWIFSDDQYTQSYHVLYQQFLDEVDVQAIIDEAAELIAPYVERDPTKFCTYEEFQAGVDALRSFCDLRTQSVRGQLDGTIPSTEEGQQEDSSALVDASGLTVSDMGSMGRGGGNGGPQRGEKGSKAAD